MPRGRYTLKRVLDYDVDLDRVFHALADSGRRSMVERLTRGPASVSELGRPLGMTLSAVVPFPQLAVVTLLPRVGPVHCRQAHEPRERLRTLAAERPRWGGPRLTWLLRRESVQIAHRNVERLYATHGLPKTIVLDNGPEFTGQVPDAWAHRRSDQLQFIRPSKPVGECVHRELQRALQG